MAFTAAKFFPLEERLVLGVDLNADEQIELGAVSA
jgi:hypothetical protein